MSRHVRTRCGKRPVPLRTERREDGATVSAVETVVKPTGEIVTTFYRGGKSVGVVPRGRLKAPDGVLRVQRHNSQGEAVGPRSTATVFLPENFRQRREFLRKWERAGLTFRPLVKGHVAVRDGDDVRWDKAPLRRGTDFAYGVQGDPVVIAAMRGDTRCQGLQEARLARHSLNTGEFARKPRPKDNPVRRQVTYRETNGQPLFVRI